MADKIKTSGPTDASIDKLDRFMEFMNDRHFIVRVTGKQRVGVERNLFGQLIPYELQTYEDFNKAYYDQEIAWEEDARDKDGKPIVVQKVMLKGKYFLGSPNAREYDGIIFNPAKDAPTNYYNIWKGFTYEAEPDKDWSLFRGHVRTVMCGEDDELFAYVVGWMAFAVQHPETPPEVALVLRGPKGTGKGTFANLFGAIFGRHFMAVSHRSHVIGHFNSHLKHTALLFVDEGFWAGDQEGEGVLKMLRTEPNLPIEPKGFDVETCPNRLHVIIASNESWVVPARGMERRFCVLDVSDEHAKDYDYFAAIRAQMKDGGYGAMLHDLLEADISHFQVREAPSTEALIDQIVHSLKPFEAWWFGRLSEGRLLSNKAGWGEAPTASLYRDYDADDKKKKHTLTKQQFSGELRHALPDGGLVKARPGNGASRGRVYKVPSLKVCRAEWDRIHGLTMPWSNEEETK